MSTASVFPARGRDRAGAVVVVSDITPLKELEKQRARAEQLSNLQRLTQTLAHEIGNPLVPIKTMTRLLPERAGDQSFVEKVARIVPREVERIEALVARLRRVVPSTETSRAEIDLRVPLRHALEVVEAGAANQGTRLESELPSIPARVLGDSAEVEELFLNLLTNALEAVADLPIDSRHVSVSLRVEGHTAIVEIRDKGRGIPSDLLDRIFDPFISTKSRGSGLGLAICSGIVARHHGQLTAANATTGGAIFTVVLRTAE